MSDFRFELNGAGVRELLQSPEMAELIGEQTAQVAGRAGAGYAHDVQTHNRVVGRVYPDSKDAVKDNYKNNTLLNALGGGR